MTTKAQRQRSKARLKQLMKDADFSMTPEGEWLTNGHFVVARHVLVQQGLGLDKPGEDRAFYKAAFDVTPDELKMSQVLNLLPSGDGRLEVMGSEPDDDGPQQEKLTPFESTAILNDSGARVVTRLYLGVDTGAVGANIWLDTRYLDLLSPDAPPPLWGIDGKHQVFGYTTVDVEKEQAWASPDFIIMPVVGGVKVTIEKEVER